MSTRRLVSCATAVVVAGAVAVPAFAAKTYNVSVRDDFFKPKSLRIKKNDSVKWTWRGDAPHNVVVRKGPVKFNSTTKTSGTYKKKFTRKGTYTIVCTIHLPDMKMTVRVS